MPPEEVRAMDLEDVVSLAASAGIEADEVRKVSKGGASEKPGTTKSRLKKR